MLSRVEWTLTTRHSSLPQRHLNLGFATRVFLFLRKSYQMKYLLSRRCLWRELTLDFYHMDLYTDGEFLTCVNSTIKSPSFMHGRDSQLIVLVIRSAWCFCVGALGCLSWGFFFLRIYSPSVFLSNHFV